jgi:guanylate kinase
LEIRLGKILAVSAPSGTGKTTIVKQILKDFPDLVFSISATTRSKRSEETNGKEYFFITEEEFKEKINNEEFVEWERFYDYYYGTYKSFLEENIQQGKSVLLEIDVYGALNVKRIYPGAKLIFIYPPSYDELVNRLMNRKTESEEDFKKRIERAKMELSLKDKFDYFVENKDLKKAILETKSIINNIIKEND